MFVLLALLWCVYLCDSFVRLPRGAWIFRASGRNCFRGSPDAALQLAAGAFDLAWTPLLPSQLAFFVSGSQLSVHSARQRFDDLQRRSRWPKAASGMLFTWVMCVLPALIATDRFLALMVPWAIVAASFHAAAFLAFVVAYRRLHGSRPRLETWLTLALSPVSLMRAPVVISLDALQGVHPLAAAAVASDDEEFLRIARIWYFDAPDLRKKVEQIAGDRDVARQLLAGPVSWEPGVSQYCPRCHGTFTPAASRCTDCDEIPLRPLDVPA